jgi:hypothetical protein
VLYNVACTYAIGGLKDEALDRLELAKRTGSAPMPYILPLFGSDSVDGLPYYVMA